MVRPNDECGNSHPCPPPAASLSASHQVEITQLGDPEPSEHLCSPTANDDDQGDCVGATRGSPNWNQPARRMDQETLAVRRDDGPHFPKMSTLESYGDQSGIGQGGVNRALAAFRAGPRLGQLAYHVVIACGRVVYPFVAVGNTLHCILSFMDCLPP